MVKPAKILAWPIRPRRSWKPDALFMAGTAAAALAIGAICGGVSRVIYRIAAS